MAFVLETSKQHSTISAATEADAAAVKERRARIEELLSDIERYASAVDYFYGGTELPKLDSDHDISHIARTLVLASILIQRAEARGVRIDRDVVYWSLVFHDICSNESDEPDHAEEAAKIISTHVLGSSLFSESQAHQIIANVKYHNKKHANIPDHVWTEEFHIMTNADALDLVRIPIERVGDIILTTPDAWEIRFAADALYRESRIARSDDPFENVLLAALEL